MPANGRRQLVCIVVSEKLRGSFVSRIGLGLPYSGDICKFFGLGVEKIA